MSHSPAMNARAAILAVALLAVAAGPSEFAYASDDAVFANYNSTNRVCESDGSGGFVCSDVSADQNLTGGVALGYIDGDPHLDAVFANESDERNRVCFGDGVGGFANCAEVSTDEDFSKAVALGYINGDQSLDIVFANLNDPDRVCLGDGGGGFNCSAVSAETRQTTAVALGLVDGDANLDAVFGDLGVNRVCLGDGSGGFVCNNVGAAILSTEGVAAAVLFLASREAEFCSGTIIDVIGASYLRS